MLKNQKMNKFMRRLLIAIPAFITYTGMAQIQQFSLAQAVEYAKENSPFLQNSKLDVEIAKKQVKEVTSTGLPQINGKVDYNGQPKIPTQVVPNFIDPNGPPLEFQMGISNSLLAQVQVSQLIFDGTYFLGLKAAKQYVELSSRMVASSLAETEANVTKAYYLALITQENAVLVDSNLALIQKTFNDTKILQETGFAEKIDVQRLKLQLSNLEIQKKKLQDQKLMTLRLLKMHMGMDVNSEIELSDDLPGLVEKVKDLNAEANPDFKARPDFKVLEQTQVLNELNLKRYRMGYWPSLRGFASHQQQTFAQKDQFEQLGNKFYGGTMVGLTLNVPIFDGFYKRAKVQQSQLSILKTRNDMRNLGQVIQNDIFNARTKYITAVEEVENQKANLELAREIYKIADVKFSEGVGSSLELTTANTDMKVAETNYLNSIYDLLIAEIDYKKATGQIK